MSKSILCSQFPELNNFSEERLQRIAEYIGDDQFHLDVMSNDDVLSFQRELKGDLRRGSMDLVLIGLRELKEKSPGFELP
jgi:hypothetical protein